MYYLLLTLSALLFSGGFLFQKFYEQDFGNGLKPSITMVFYQSVVVCVSMFVIGGFRMEVTGFSFLMATIYAVNDFLLTWMSLKALKYANLSVFSMFMMLGSIVLPSAFGILFYDEGITVMKILCYILIFAALYLSVEKGASSKKAVFYYIAVFVGNGMCGILSKIHQSNAELQVSTESFLLQSGLIRLVICAVILICLMAKSREKIFSWKAVGLSVGGGVSNAVGNYFNLFALLAIPISVHSVMTTGMVLIFSALIGLFVKERPSRKGWISLLLSLAAAIVAAF